MRPPKQENSKRFPSSALRLLILARISANNKSKFLFCEPPNGRYRISYQRLVSGSVCDEMLGLMRKATFLIGLSFSAHRSITSSLERLSCPFGT